MKQYIIFLYTLGEINKYIISMTIIFLLFDSPPFHGGGFVCLRDPRSYVFQELLPPDGICQGRSREQFTLPRIELMGPHRGTRPGECAQGGVPVGYALACGAWPGTTQRGDMGSFERRRTLLWSYPWWEEAGWGGLP